MFSDIRCLAIFSPFQSVYSRKQHGLPTLRLEQGRIAQRRFSATMGRCCAFSRHQLPLFNVAVTVSSSLHRQRLTWQLHSSTMTGAWWKCVIGVGSLWIHRSSGLLVMLGSERVLTVCCYERLTHCPKESRLQPALQGEPLRSSATESHPTSLWRWRALKRQSRRTREASASEVSELEFILKIGSSKF